MRREILIPSPQVNPDANWRTSYSYNRPEVKKRIITELQKANITTDGYPNVADFGAGDGSIPAILTEYGWKPENIVCFDKYISKRPLITGVMWIYLDIWDLNLALTEEEVLPASLDIMKHKFDLVTFGSVGLGREQELFVGGFFARRGGFIFLPDQYFIKQV